jgi:ABC-2 type transport system permease protein
LPRLEVSPVSKISLLLGKALACFITIYIVLIFLTFLGVILGMKPDNFSMLAVVGACVAAAFSGIMLSVSVLGKTEQGVSGAGWAINMIIAMLGGAMIPAMFLPDFMQTWSWFSPIRWSINGIEGAIWRGFSWPEVAIPCLILLATGLVGMSLGTAIWMRRRLA